MSEPFIHETEPSEAFTALSDGTRLTILQALWESDDSGMTFSELRTAVDARESGGFNYHLGKLVERFVTKSDGTYRLTQAGKHVCAAIASGIYTARGTLDPVELNGRCETSGDRLRIEYESETIRIGCDSCPACPSGWNVPAPPSVFAGYDHDAIPGVVDRYIRTISRQAINGFCPYCNGRMQPTVRPFEATNTDAAASASGSENGGSSHDQPTVQFDCQRCGADAGLALDHALLLADSIVANFYYDNGIDVQEYPIWEFPELSPVQLAVVNRNPFRVDVTFRADGSVLTVCVDETFAVTRSDDY